MANEKISFLSGALGVSFVWFFGIGYGAALLKPIFARPHAWQVLEFLIGITMLRRSYGLFRFCWNTLPLSYHSQYFQAA